MEKRLGFDPAQQDSEGEEEAVAAGRAMRERQRALLTQVPELPDRYDLPQCGLPLDAQILMLLPQNVDVYASHPAQTQRTRLSRSQI